MDYVTRGVCGQESCRERRYYLDNGLWFCRRGHLQEGRQIEEDPDDFGTQGRTHRVKHEKEERSRKTARGRQANTLLLQGYQLILWQQCHALVNEHGFPEELEGVVRDLWALRLRGFSLKITQSAEDEGDESEPELFSSQASATEDSDEMGLKSRSRYLEWPRLIEAVCLCYLASVLMRLPICVHDLHRLIVRQELPYIRALKTVPSEIKHKLPPEFVAILDIKKIPKLETLHRTCRDLAIFYQRKFGIVLPSMNSPIILYRHIKRLAVPIDVYEIIKTLQSYLGFTFKYPDQLAENRRKHSLHLPEVQMVVLIVMATKLLFPFDDIERHPATTMEPATQSMNWQAWMQAQQQFDAEKVTGVEMGKEKIIQMTDSDVLGMDPSKLDEYMDWYEKSWLGTQAVTNQITDLFPVSQEFPQPLPDSEEAPEIPVEVNNEEEALNTMLQRVMESVVAVPSVPREEGKRPPRPGVWYHRYRWVSTLPEKARLFYEISAQLAGVDLETLVRAVTVAEWRVAHWQDEQRRADYAEFGFDSNEEDDDMYGEVGGDNEDLDELQLRELHEQWSDLDVD
ncbi:uncharacterized protein N7483_011026 [Penicillium malachiteum]|uniref:uncharacterized protein n=1 Tax=Penicillium malachiteum TaxID=1324776 RepID=UPI0025494A63|nr:uncharacterized protein N7483_011026 [Penicillium malachiteum]KAJ5713845.1 hypothetical protein N7483_011026 [Penicillium malachiteum]